MNLNESKSKLDINIELFYEKIGSTNGILDGIQLYLFIPFSSICVLLNLLVCIILSDKTKFTG